MKTFTVIAIILSLILIAIATTLEGAFTVVFGWIPFLGRVLPQVKPDGPSMLVGVIALFLFGIGIHWLGRSWRKAANPAGAGWRVRWTASVVLGVTLLFAAGISLVGITHQIAWLATSEEPMIVEGLGKSSSSTENNLKMIDLGLENYDSTYSTMPLGGTFTANGEMLHSWETQILVFMVYASYGIDKQRPWNGPENERYFKCIVPEFINPDFRSPALEDANGFGLSHYAANSNVLAANKSMALADITGGKSEIILVGEVRAGFKPWGHPVNWRDPAAGMNGDAATFGGPPKNNGTNFLMADGSVRFISKGADPSVLRALGNPRKE